MRQWRSCSDGSSGNSGPSERARYESSDSVLTFNNDNTFVLEDVSKAAAVARAIGKTIKGTYTGDPVTGTDLKLTASDGTEITVSGSGSTLTITVDGTSYQFTKKSGGSGSENPFGFTEKDKNNFFCLDKDGKVLQKVFSYETEGKDVEGTVFVVFWTGEVKLYGYYGDYEDVTIPDGVTIIYYGAFTGCTSLASVTIPDSVTEIDETAFQGCSSLASVKIPDSVTKIGERAFSDCTSLASVTIPASVEGIGNGTFYGCTSLKEVRYNNTIKRFKDSIVNNAFEKGVVIHCTDGNYVFGSDAE